MRLLGKLFFYFFSGCFLLTLLACKKDSDGCTNPVTSYPAGVSTAPSMTYYYGASNASTGTTLTATGQISGNIAASGCGPFGVWESSNSGEVATEIEMRLSTRVGVFAMADGVITSIQESTGPMESGEVEGVWVRYGTNYAIKYAHVTNPIVSVGQQITSGQRLGTTVAMNNGQFFWETELRYKSGGTTYAKACNSLLTNSSVFDSLYGAGNCVPGGTIKGTDGTTTVTASNWLNDSLTTGIWDVTGTDQACTFP